MKNTVRLVSVFGAGLVASVNSAVAAAPDVTAVTTEIGLAVAPVAAVGGAVLLVLVTVAVYKWIRRAM